MRLVARLRGIIGTAILWGVAWAPLGLLWGSVFWIDSQMRARGQPIPFPPVGGFVIMCAAWGFVAGALLATTLSVSERRRTHIESMSTRRVAILGAVAGMALPLVFAGAGTPQMLTQSMVVVLAGAFGAAISAGMLRLSRRSIPVLPAGASNVNVLSGNS